MKFLKKLFKRKSNICIKSNNNSLTIGGPKQSIRLYLNDNNDLNIKVFGNIELDVNGEMSILSSGDFSIDTINSKLYFNSKMSSQIRNNKSSIEYRKRQENNVKQLLSKAEEATKVLESIDAGTPITQDQKDIIDIVRQQQTEVLQNLKKQIRE